MLMNANINDTIDDEGKRAKEKRSNHITQYQR